MHELLLKVPFVEEGGVVMVLLYCVSLLGLTLVLERLYVLQRNKILPVVWAAQVRGIVAQSGFKSMGDDTIWPDNDAADVLRQVVRTGQAVGGIEPAAIDQAVFRKEGQLMSGVTVLGLLAAISPLLGLLGTVAGMIETFSMIATGGIGDPKALAGGIYQALYTTAGGLSIAIPLTVAYRLLRHRAMLLTDDIAAFVEELVWLNRKVDRDDKQAGEDKEKG